MCGISGFNWQDRELIETMSAKMAHRGPDAVGYFCEDGISFGHNRLAIIDLSPEANQPMTDSEERFVITFNGEIFNFQEIKSELGDYPFRTKSDTEVILAGYQKWGKEVVKKLNGQFALAIWDKQKKELFLARDESGVKPLFYYFDGEHFIFASEVKAILAHNVPRKLNIEAFNHYLRLNYVPAPLTMIAGVQKLPPGYIATLKGTQLEISPYSHFSRLATRIPYEKVKADLRTNTIEAVKRQLIADVPVGVYLSGGIDSSVVLFAMKQFQKKIKTFSVGFELQNIVDTQKFNQDFELAKKTAEFFSVDHHPLMMTGDDVVSLFHEAVTQNDSPVSNPTSIAMMFLAREARKEVTVALTGNGGDELFGGYERYRLTLISEIYQKIPSLIRSVLNLFPRLRKLDAGSGVDLYARFMFEKDSKIARIVSNKFFHDDTRIKQLFDEMYFKDKGADEVLQFMDADKNSWLADQALELGDKMSMRSGLEERVPLLDKKLIQYASALPRNFLVTLGQTKKIFKDAFRNDLPDFLFSQPKRGWMAPGAKWLRHPKIQSLVKEILSEGYYEETKDLFDFASLQKMLDDHIEGRDYNLTLLWSALTFQAWAKEYKVLI